MAIDVTESRSPAALGGHAVYGLIKQTQGRRESRRREIVEERRGHRRCKDDVLKELYIENRRLAPTFKHHSQSQKD